MSQRDMRWLHRLLHHRQQVGAQVVQINLIAQGSAEGRQRLFGIILAPIKATVDQRLEPSAHCCTSATVARVEMISATGLSAISPLVSVARLCRPTMRPA